MNLKQSILLFFLSMAPLLSLAAELPQKIVKNGARKINDFLPPPDGNYLTKYLKPAKALQKALNSKPSNTDALLSLSKSGTMAEHATYALALSYREANKFEQSNVQLYRLLSEFSPTVYADQIPDLVLENTCDKALTKTLPKKTIDQLFSCLIRLPWKEWQQYESQVASLYQNLLTEEDPRLKNFVGEILLAMPAATNIRKTILKNHEEVELKQWSELAKYKLKSISPSGVKPVFPDQEKFEAALELFRKKDYSEAASIWEKIPVDFPQTDMAPRCRFWQANALFKDGKTEQAQQLWKKIFADELFSYYGMASAAKLGIDLKSSFSNLPPESEEFPKWKGNLFPRHLQSLWKSRALQEAGLNHQAQMESLWLFNSKPGGISLGQDNGRGALALSRFFSTSEADIAAFSHFVSAVGMQPELVNSTNLKLLFPMRFAEEYLEASQLTGLSPLLLASISRQESAFFPFATSKADARGVMQLLLTTAKEVNPNTKKLDLYDKRKNILLGSQYINQLLDRFEGNIIFALAGYNAGPSKAALWQKQFMEIQPAPPKDKIKNIGKTFSAEDWEMIVERIPYLETRKYVSNILRNLYWYSIIYLPMETKSWGELIWVNKAPAKKETQTEVNNAR